MNDYNDADRMTMSFVALNRDRAGQITGVIWGYGATPAAAYRDASQWYDGPADDLKVFPADRSVEALIDEHGGDEFVLCVSDAGDGGWSLHAPGSSDEDIADGTAPALVSGKGWRS